MPVPDSAFGPEGLLAAIEAKERGSRPRDRRVAMLRRYAGLVGVFVALVGIVVMMGWCLGIDRVTRLGVGLASMKFGTAANFAGIGLSLFLASRRTGSERPRGQLLLHVIGGAYAALMFLQYLGGFNAGLDNPFGLDQRATEFPGRMSEATSIGLLLLWAGLSAVALARVRLSQGLAVAALGLGTVTLLGYAYGVDALYQFGPFSSTALHTAIGLTAAGGALLLLRADQGFMSLLTGNTAGGIIVRWMAPLAIVTPMVVGALVVPGLGGLYSAPVAMALFATIVAAISGSMIFYGGGRLRNVDLQRAGAEETLRAALEAIKARDLMAEELKAAERRRREILDSAAEAYVATDVDGIAVEWNQAAGEMFGWSRDEMIGQRVRDLIVNAAESERARSLMLVDAPDDIVPEGSVLGRQIPLVGRHKQGGNLDIEVTTWRLGNGAERTHHSLMTDVTARRRAEKELRLALDDIGDFSSAMAHDLKGPLTVVKGYSQMLEGKLEDEFLVQLSRRITEAADRGINLIDDILAFAEIGGTKRTEKLVDLTALVKRVAAHEQSSVDRPTTVRVEPMPGIVGDESLLRQMFANLVGNAMKYVPEDRDPEVSIAAVVDSDNGTIDLRICDNGDPISREDRERIFAMFSRGSNTGGRQGTGVGLAICQRVAELHGGSILVESSLAGNCFIATLPFSDPL